MKDECQNLLMNTKLVDEKYTKKYSKRNGIHQVGLKEDKRR